MSALTKLLRVGEGKKVRRLAQIVPLIDALEPEMEALDDEALAHRTVELRERLGNGEDLDDLLVDSFAAVREAAWRVIGQRHYPVQLMGGMALHFGWIAEMKTGEGKTLVSTLPVYLNGLTGEGVHVVTVNDYLAARDAAWMGQVHRFLGLSIGLIVPSIEDSAARRSAYECDVTYGTNTEFGFDYLRDNMCRSRDAMVQRGHTFAIVDEVDSILIDEARTPLIISGPATESARLYYQFAGIARSLRAEVDYEVDEEKRTIAPTEDGIAKVERQLGVANLYEAVSVNYVHQLTQALRAKELYKRDKDYIVADGEVKIVDEFTGRILDGRRWSDGLHQAAEAKERVAIKDENHTWATVTLQNYFRLYDKLCGMTGTAETEASEFAGTYDIPVVPIPTNEPMVRVDHADLIYKSEMAKFNAVVEDLVERRETGQPVLVGTASVAKSELLASLLETRGIPHEVLNAKQHAREAQIVAQAGRLGAITVATNMAGRGVDIVLGGNPEGLALDEARAEGLDLASEEGAARLTELVTKFTEECKAAGDRIRELGGLYVLGSERHESRRIDNQLRGRSGRQGDPGESRFYLSLEDELMRLFATGAMNWVMGRALPEDTPIEAKMVSKAIERAQTTVEARNAEVRKDVLKYDDVMNEQRKVIYARRMQVLDGEDLHDRTTELLESAIASIVVDACPGDFPEDWDFEALASELHQYYPTGFVADDLADAVSTEQITDSIVAEAREIYEERNQTMPGGAETARALERDIMLQIIDQRWREHLSEMDYLREGINLRAMGQQDPLVAWQKDGYQMFGALMASVDDDYLRYVLHVEVLIEPVAPEPDLSAAHYQGADEPVPDLSSLMGIAGAGDLPDVVTGPGPLAPVMRASTGGDDVGPGGSGLGADVAPEMTPGASGSGASGSGAGGNGASGNGASGNGASGNAVGDTADAGRRAPEVRSEEEKLGRNEPCWCGSGLKFKLCHGRQ